MSKKLKMPETEEEYDKYSEDLKQYILDEWKKKGTVSDEENTKEYLDMFLHLLAQYRVKCLLATIIDVDNLQEKFDEKYNWKE